MTDEEEAKAARWIVIAICLTLVTITALICGATVLVHQPHLMGGAK